MTITLTNLTADALAEPSSVPGYPALKIDINRAQRYLDACMAAHVRYGLGAKCPEDQLGLLPVTFRSIDCSGFARSVIAAGTEGRVIIPDGSVMQHEWAQSHGFKVTSYDNCDLSDGHLRIAFHAPNSDESVGHVWLDYMGKTLESWGGHGPGSRPVETSLLERLVTAVYVLA